MAYSSRKFIHSPIFIIVINYKIYFCVGRLIKPTDMRIATLLFCLCLAVGATAQITVTNASFPSVGDTLRFKTDANPPALNLGVVGGTTQLWDFTALQGGAIQTTVYLNAATGTSYPQFPGSNMRIVETGRETYYKKSNTAFEVLGTSGIDQLNLGLNTTVHYQPALTERRAPMNFFDIHNLETNLSYSVPTGGLLDSLLGNLGGLIDSFRFRITTKRLDVVDGAGVCKIPGGSFDVLREKRTQTTETNIDVHTLLGWTNLSALLGGNTGGGLLGQIGKDTTVTYHFFSNTAKETIAVLTLSNANGAVQSVRFKYIPTLATAVSDVSMPSPVLILSPNPARAQTQMQFEHFLDGNYLLLEHIIY